MISLFSLFWDCQMYPVTSDLQCWTSSTGSPRAISNEKCGLLPQQSDDLNFSTKTNKRRHALLEVWPTIVARPDHGASSPAKTEACPLCKEKLEHVPQQWEWLKFSGRTSNETWRINDEAHPTKFHVPIAEVGCLPLVYNKVYPSRWWTINMDRKIFLQ